MKNSVSMTFSSQNAVFELDIHGNRIETDDQLSLIHCQNIHWTNILYINLTQFEVRSMKIEMGFTLAGVVSQSSVFSFICLSLLQRPTARKLSLLTFHLTRPVPYSNIPRLFLLIFITLSRFQSSGQCYKSFSFKYFRLRLYLSCTLDSVGNAI